MSTRPAKDGQPWSRAGTWRFQTKAVLRSAAAYVGKGAEALHFYAPDGDLQILDLAASGGGQPMRALARFMAAFAGPDRPATRTLTLTMVAGCGGGTQFDGDGTAAHPALANREVVAFFPFQVDEKRFVAPVYVMTRDLARAYGAGAALTDPTRFDLPPETYELTIAGVRGEAVLVQATDPLAERTVEVTVRARAAGQVTVAVPLTDAPLLLLLNEP